MQDTVPTSPITLLPLVIIDWKSIRIGGLIGFAKARLGQAMIINDIPVSCANGHVFAGTPGKPVIGRDGLVVKNDRGRVTYTPVMEWEGRAARERWSASVLAAIIEKY